MAGRVVDEEHRRGLQAQLGAHQLVDRQVGLGDAQLARVEDHVELVGDAETVEIGGESTRAVGEEADPGAAPDLADERENRVVHLSARCRPRRDRGGPALPESAQHLGAPFLIGDLPGDHLVEETGRERDRADLVVPFGVAGKAADYSVEVEESSVDHPPSAAAQHVERGTGPEPGDVLVGHRVRGGDVFGRAVGMVHHDLHRPARRQLGETHDVDGVVGKDALVVGGVGELQREHTLLLQVDLGDAGERPHDHRDAVHVARLHRRVLT